MEKAEKKKDKAISKAEEEAKKQEKSRQEYLKTIKYKSDGDNYSFELEKREYKIKGFPSIIEEAKILAIYSSIAPDVISSEEAIFNKSDIYLKTLSKGIAYAKVMVISCKERDEEIDFDPLFLDKEKKSDSILISAFGMCIFSAENEFKNSKKKQS